MQITRSFMLDAATGRTTAATLHLTLTRSDALSLSILLDAAAHGLTDHDDNDEYRDLAVLLQDELDHIADMLKGT